MIDECIFIKAIYKITAMKNIYAFFLGILFTTSIFAQGTIVAFTIDPPSPTTADFVKVYVDIMFTSGACDVDNQGHSTSGSNTSAYAHHCIGMLTVICNAVDTFNLGMLPAGSHIFDMTLTSGSGGPPCTPGIVPDDIRNTTFTVTPATGIISAQNSKTSMIYPNPLHAIATVKIDQSLKLTNAEFKITDISGRTVKVQNGIQTNEFTFDRDKLSTGIYFYQLVQEDKIVTNGKLVIQ